MSLLTISDLSKMKKNGFVWLLNSQSSILFAILFSMAYLQRINHYLFLPL